MIVLFYDSIFAFLGELSPEEVSSIQKQALLSDRIYELMMNSIEIMDEVDIILHPLKSELNWPLGAKGDVIISHICS